MKKATFNARLRLIQRLRPVGRVLDVGCASGAFLSSAAEAGWSAEGIEQSAEAATYASQTSGAPVHIGTLETYQGPDQAFDVVHMADVIEHMRQPRSALARVRRLLTHNGLLVLTTPDVNSLSAQLLRSHWPNFKPEHLFYPDKRTIAMLLKEAGFRLNLVRPAVKALSLDFADDYFRVYGPAPCRVVTSAARSLLPRRALAKNWFVSAGDMLVVAEVRT
jgi:SAM-dependent methyltransferase